MTADELRAARNRLGWTNARLAEALGMNYSTMIHWMQTGVPRRYEKLAALAVEALDKRGEK
jgi:transcriptional regulator with XRE-family HTH domain